MSEGMGSISQIVFRNGKDYTNGIKQLFALLSKVSHSSRYNVQQAILFLMESNHEWANILSYAQKWKSDVFMKELIYRMKMRVNEPESPPPQSGLIDQLRRLIQKCWMLKSPKKNQNVYSESPPLGDNIKISNTYQGDKYNTTQIRANLPAQPTQNQTKKLGSELVESSVVNEVGQSKQRSDPLSNVTGRPTILKKSSILTNNNLQSKGDKIDLNIQKNERNQTKNIQNIAKSDNVIKLLLNYKNNKLNQQQQHRQKQKADTITCLLIPKAPTKSIDEQCPPQRFNFGSNRKSEVYKTITVSPKKFDPDQFILKIKVKQPTAAPKQDPVSQIKSIYDFSFTKQKPKSPKQVLNVADTNFDSFYELQKLPESQPVVIQIIPKAEEHVDSDPPPVISNQTTPMFNIPIKIPQPRKYVESLTQEDLKMLGSDVKVTNIFKDICQGMGLVAIKYFDQAMKVDF